MSNRNGQLPRGWELRALPDIAQINPPLDRCVVSDDVEIDFVPMRAVDPEGGGLSRPEVSTYGRVKKGYTPFLAGDVITAKITPCMENGKTCVVPRLAGVACFGSTEFHVIRAESGIDARWISNFLLQHSTRHLAQRQMMGGVGQMRVPTGFLESLKIPIPPSHEQERSLEKLDELLSDLDAGLAALERVRAKLKHYRAAVLKAAVEGTLTAEWRAHHPVIEPASVLLERILAERRSRWEEALVKKFKDAGKEPPKNWKAKYKEPAAADSTKLPTLPSGWCWATVEQLSAPEINSITDGPFGSNLKTSHYTHTGPRVIRLQNIKDGGFADERAHISDERFERLRKHSVLAGDIVIAGLGENPPRACLIPEWVGPAIVKADCIRFKPHAAVSAKSLCFFLNSLPTRTRMKQVVHGVGRPRLNLSEIRSIILPLAPAEEQERISSSVEDQFSVIDHLEVDLDANLKSARALRQSVLRHAFEGKLVPQDPNDEPASELLKRVAAERKMHEEHARLVKASKKVKAKAKTPRKKAARP